jgi:hypothetical protein
MFKRGWFFRSSWISWRAASRHWLARLIVSHMQPVLAVTPNVSFRILLIALTEALQSNLRAMMTPTILGPNSPCLATSDAMADTWILPHFGHLKALP